MQHFTIVLRKQKRQKKRLNKKRKEDTFNDMCEKIFFLYNSEKYSSNFLGLKERTILSMTCVRKTFFFKSGQYSSI